DKPKENGIRNLVSIPQAIAKGLPLPSPSRSEQREVRTTLLNQVGSLHSRQSSLRDAVVAASSDAGKPALAPEANGFADKQSEINARLQSLATQIDQDAAALQDPARVKAVAEKATEQSAAALAALRDGDRQTDEESQRSMVK